MFDWRNLPFDVKQKILRSLQVSGQDWSNERLNNLRLNWTPMLRPHNIRKNAANTIRKAWTTTLPRFPMACGRAHEVLESDKIGLDGVF